MSKSKSKSKIAETKGKKTTKKVVTTAKKQIATTTNTSIMVAGLIVEVIAIFKK